MDEVILTRNRQEAYEQGYQDGKVDGYNLAGALMSLAKQEQNTAVGYVPPLKKTNADRIRSMTDEELAQHLFDVANYACPPGKEFTTVSCGKDPDCEQCWLGYLRQEVDDGT